MESCSSLSKTLPTHPAFPHHSQGWCKLVPGLQGLRSSGAACGGADVILPGAAYTEKFGTFVNMEGRVQSTKVQLVMDFYSMLQSTVLSNLAVQSTKARPAVG